MIKLHGFAVSNYFNMVKMALIEMEIPFEVVETKTSQDAGYLVKSPMGKVPCIETPEGFLSETSVIFDYLEDLGTGKTLYPASAYEKAKVRELVKEIELYIELPARTCYGEAFFGGTDTEETKSKALASLKKGIACLKRNGKFSPYVAGDTFTFADIMFMYTLGLTARVGKKVLGENLMEDFPEAKELSGKIATRESAIQIAADQKA